MKINRKIFSNDTSISYRQIVLESGIIFLILLFVFLITTDVNVQAIVPYLIGICTLLFIAASILHRKNKMPLQVELIVLLTAIASVIIFLFVGVTGWLYSPYFYILYALCLALVFLIKPLWSFSIILILVGLLIPQISSFDRMYDFISVLLLLLIIPISYVLRREHLRVVEKQKKILILEKEGVHARTLVQKVLSNKVHKVSVEIRQPLNDIKQISLYLRSTLPKDKHKYVDQIIESAKEGLDTLRVFEEDTTGTKMHRSTHE